VYLCFLRKEKFIFVLVPNGIIRIALLNGVFLGRVWKFSFFQKSYEKSQCGWHCISLNMENRLNLILVTGFQLKKKENKTKGTKIK